MKKQTLKNNIALIAIFSVSLLLDINLLIPIILTAIFVYASFWQERKFKEYAFLPLSLLFLCAFTCGYWVYLQSLPLWYIPFSFIIMLVIILWQDLMLSLFMSLAVSLSLAIHFKNLDL